MEICASGDSNGGRCVNLGGNEMKLGVVGLPNVGKSTLFNAITCAGAQAAN